MSTSSTTMARVAIAISGLAVGAAAVSLAYEWGDLFLVPDLVTGLAFVALAARAWPTSRATCWLAAALARCGKRSARGSKTWMPRADACSRRQTKNGSGR